MVITNAICLLVNSFLFVICITQILANFIVLYVWTKHRQLYKNDNLILLVSLAFIDFLYAIEQFPYLIILMAGHRPDNELLDYDPATIILLGGASAALMKGGCTITSAIALDRIFALYFPVFYYQQNKKWWSIFCFLLALALAVVDWLICILIVPIVRHPGASNFGAFASHPFRVWWGLSNMAMNLVTAVLTVVIIYHLVRRKQQRAELVEIERTNRAKVDRSANRVAFYIVIVSTLIGVVPGLLNGFALFIEIPILNEISFFVGSCATLSGLSHAFIFAMAHRLTGEARSAMFTAQSSNVVRVRWNPNGGVYVRRLRNAFGNSPVVILSFLVSLDHMLIAKYRHIARVTEASNSGSCKN